MTPDCTCGAPWLGGADSRVHESTCPLRATANDTPTNNNDSPDAPSAPPTTPDHPQQPEAPDLMAALMTSIERARADRSAGADAVGSVQDEPQGRT